MRRTTAAALLIVGAIAMGAETHSQCTKYSSERIWNRQRSLIERTLRRSPQLKEAKFEELRKGLDNLKDASSKEKCIFETNFQALLKTGGDKEKADKLIARRSYVPYAHCEPGERFKRGATKWYTLVGALAFVAGLLRLIVPYIRRKRHEKRMAAE